jgi:hypothetical protein
MKKKSKNVYTKYLNVTIWGGQKDVSERQLLPFDFGRLLPKLFSI